MSVREYTNKLLDAIHAGDINAIAVLEICLKYMSEHDVRDMCRCYDLLDEEEPSGSFDEHALDLLDAELAKLNVGASLYSSEDAAYVEVKSDSLEDIEAVKRIIKKQGYQISHEEESESSDYRAYYMWIFA